MSQNRKINPDRLRTLLARYPLSQKELAARIGVDVGTVSRWKNDNPTRIRQGVLAILCEELKTTPTELCADGPLPEADKKDPNARRDQVTMMLDTACRNQLALVARRYGVTRQQIVEIAPLLFALMAERSLAERQRQLDSCYSAAPAHFRDELRGRYDEDDRTLLDAEQASINDRDLFAMHAYGWNEDYEQSNPLARFLNEELESVVLPKALRVSWDRDEAPRYAIGIDELIDLLGRDREACLSVLEGKVALAEMPGDIRRATPETRASWVKERGQAIKLPEFTDLNIDDLVKSLVEATKRDKEAMRYDF